VKEVNLEDTGGANEMNLEVDSTDDVMRGLWTEGILLYCIIIILYCI